MGSSPWWSGGSGEHHSSEHGPARPDEQAEQNDRLKGDIGGKEIGDRGADPDSEGEGNEGENASKPNSLLWAAMLSEKQATEGAAAGGNAGNGSHHAQLYQKRDQDEPVSHPLTVSRCGGGAQMQTCGGSAAYVDLRGASRRCDDGARVTQAQSRMGTWHLKL